MPQARFSPIGFVALLTLSPSASGQESAIAKEPLAITRVTPEGEDVPAGRQIVFSFNHEVVPLGRMERKADEVPITVEPALNCQWRWINTSALACNLDEKEQLKQATRYRITVKPGITDMQGVTLVEEAQFNFTTKRPDAGYVLFKTWKGPQEPVIRVSFNMPVNRESVEEHVYFSPESGGRIRAQAQPDPAEREVPAALPVPGEKALAFITRGIKEKSDDTANAQAQRSWLITAESALPIDAAVSLKVEPGLTTPLGPEKGIGEREIVQFDTFPALSFLGIRCLDNGGNTLIIPPQGDDKRLCDPQNSISLSFSAPVQRAMVKKQFDFLPSLAGKDTDKDPWGNPEENSYSRLNAPHKKGQTYEVWLPHGMKAAQTYEVASKPRDLGFFRRIWLSLLSLFSHQPQTDITDEFGRPLMEGVKMRFATNHRNPNFELPEHDAVLEKAVDTEVPLYVNNLSSYSFDYAMLTATGFKTGQSYTQSVPDVRDTQFAVPFGIRAMLGGTSGAVYGSLRTEPWVNKQPYQRRLFAQVSPWQMQVKLGHFSTLVWLVDMQSGQPAANVKVDVLASEPALLGGSGQPLASAVTDSHGIALLPGSAQLDPGLKRLRGWEENAERLHIRAIKDADIALTPLTGDFMMDLWRASGESIPYSERKEYGHMRAWGTTAQGIYRAGDTIDYKLYVRAQNDTTLIPPPAGRYSLKIIDPMGKKVQEIKSIALSPFGAYSGSFTVAQQGAVGWYRFVLGADFTGKPDTESKDSEPETQAAAEEGGEEGDSEWQREQQPEGRITLTPMRVLVSDFTPVPFKVENSLNGDHYTAAQTVEVTTQARLHAGGAYTQANARVTALLNAAAFTPASPIAKSFRFDTLKEDRGERQIFQETKPLNDAGELKSSFAIPQQDIVYGKLTVESAVQDDRGKFIASQAQGDYIGVDRLVGLRQKQWIYETGKPASLDYLVVDDRGQLAEGSKVGILIEKEITKAARVKDAGNAYTTDFTTEWKETGRCDGVSAREPLTCSFTPQEAGIYRMTASIKDSKDRPHSTQAQLYVTGRDYVLWNTGSDTALPLIPEKNDYHVGDTARILVKNPYPGAQALVTVERYGIIDHFTQTLEGSAPVIELPIKPDYLPGFYLSVSVVSPRVEKPQSEGDAGVGQLDLGKPAMRMGYLSFTVSDPYKEIAVDAKTERDIYKPREKVRLSLHAAPRHGAEGEKMEFMVAVLDESVFDLVAGGKSYFDPYAGFYRLDGLDLRNYSLLTRLVGRQKFEKKGANPGGDGGADLSMRNLFKFVSYWNPSILPDKDGNAQVEFDAPDNLTGWRVLAVAVTPGDRFGLGQASFKVNRPTELRPVMPNQVTEGDRFQAGFSVMNRTDKPRDIKVVLTATGTLASSAKPEHSETVHLEPYKRATVYMPLNSGKVEAVREQQAGEIRITARASDAVDSDATVQSVPVGKRRSLEYAATYGTTTENNVQEPIAFPDKMMTDIGSVSVVVAPSVIGNLAGAFRYIRDYPYLCWEQILTKAVMAAHFKNLKPWLPDTLEWKDSESLPQKSLDIAVNFQAPNGGMAYFLANDGHADPYLSAYTQIAFNWMRASGYQVPEEVENKLQAYLQNLLRQDAVPDFYTEGMTSSVRAVALGALAERGKVTTEDVERYRPHLKRMSLFGKSYYLRAAQLTGDTQAAQEALKDILAHGNQTGGSFVFSEEKDDGYQRMLTSPMRDNCAILSVISTAAQTPDGAATLGDIPFKLMRTVTATRGGRDYWQNTQENIFCMQAITEYSRIYETVKPAMTVKAALDGKTFGQTQFHDFRDKTAIFERPIQPSDSGRKAMLDISREGDGRLYYAARLAYAPQDGEGGRNAGMEIRREYSVQRGGAWQLLTPDDDHALPVERGELVRVDLYLSLAAPRNFVVVDDPVPGGLEPVNRDLANTSNVDAKAGEFQAAGGSFWFTYHDWQEYDVSLWSFYHQELRHNAARFFADWLPAGNYHLSYTAQAISEGRFAIMPALAQEMYDPDVYGKTPGTALSVHAAKP